MYTEDWGVYLVEPITFIRSPQPYATLFRTSAGFQWSLAVETRATHKDPSSFENPVFKMIRRKPREFGEQWRK